MGYRIKYDINTSVSVPLLVAQNPKGEPVEQEVVYLPGAMLPPNLSPRIAQGVDDGDEHLSTLIEYIDTGEDRPSVKAVGGPLPQQQPEDLPGAPFTDYPPSSQPSIARQQEAAGGPAQPGDNGVAGADNPFVSDGTPRSAGEFVTAPDAGQAGGDTEQSQSVDYSDWKRPQLDEELAKRRTEREINVTGTGKDGNIVASDIAGALAADDAVHAPSA